MIPVQNDEFLKAIFGDDHLWSHVTSFPDDPSNIQNNRRAICWGGGYYRDTRIEPQTNQYFTISTFYADDQGKARRRKALFRQTYCVVLDDVKEKLSHDAALMLPEPSWILETSKGSEQWGYILGVPCTDANRIDNLNDGLIASDLAPDSKDPGQRGITRYVRLPEGVNSKLSKRDTLGRPYKCRMIKWTPEQRVSLEQLAEPFGINLDVERRSTTVEGAADIPDHPLLQIPEIIDIKATLSGGRFDITCPWVHEHTDEADDGAAIFTNQDGSMGFKCHHGACEQRTGYDLLQRIEEKKPGFREHYRSWNFIHSMKSVATVSAPPPPPPTISFLTPIAPPPPPPSVPAVIEANPDELISYDDMLEMIGTVPFGSQRNEAAYRFLQTVDDLDHGSRVLHWNNLRDVMGWTKSDLTTIVEQQRKKWYAEKVPEDFYLEYTYIAEQNQYYSISKRQWLSIDSFRNMFSHMDPEVQAEALISGRVQKVDRYDYAPGYPEIFTERGVRYVNAFRPAEYVGIPGEASMWLEHFKILGWAEHTKHILQFMAFTLRHPEQKINHALIFGGGEGIGKDFLLYPLKMAMGDDCVTIDGHTLSEPFNDYLMNTKLLSINELEMGDHQQARMISNRLKPLCTAPPATLRVNPKGVKGLQIRNIVNVIAGTNSALPLHMSQDSRRYFAVWSDLSIRGEDKNVTPEWREYWKARWHWLDKCQGWKACLNYLMTEVDLSDFDPGAAPTVTDFVRDMQDASADPVSSAIKDMLYRQIGIFASDLLTADDIVTGLKTVLPMTPVEYSLQRVPSAAVVGKVMRQERIGTVRRAVRDGKERKIWVVRHVADYKDLTGTQLIDTYLAAMTEIRNNAPLRGIDGGKKDDNKKRGTS